MLLAQFNCDFLGQRQVKIFKKSYTFMSEKELNRLFRAPKDLPYNKSGICPLNVDLLGIPCYKSEYSANANEQTFWPDPSPGQNSNIYVRCYPSAFHFSIAFL